MTRNEKEQQIVSASEALLKEGYTEINVIESKIQTVMSPAIVCISWLVRIDFIIKN